MYDHLNDYLSEDSLNHDYRTCEIDNCDYCQFLVDEGFICSCDFCGVVGDNHLAWPVWEIREDGMVSCQQCRQKWSIL
mgnify:FL=1